MREKLARLLDGLTGTVRLGYDDPRWDTLLACGPRVLGLSLSDPKLLDFADRMVLNNPKTGNFGSLLALTVSAVDEAVSRVGAIAVAAADSSGSVGGGSTTIHIDAEDGVTNASGSAAEGLFPRALAALRLTRLFAARMTATLDPAQLRAQVYARGKTAVGDAGLIGDDASDSGDGPGTAVGGGSGGGGRRDGKSRAMPGATPSKSGVATVLTEGREEAENGLSSTDRVASGGGGGSRDNGDVVLALLASLVSLCVSDSEGGSAPSQSAPSPFCTALGFGDVQLEGVSLLLVLLGTQVYGRPPSDQATDRQAPSACVADNVFLDVLLREASSRRGSGGAGSGAQGGWGVALPRAALGWFARRPAAPLGSAASVLAKALAASPSVRRTSMQHQDGKQSGAQRGSSARNGNEPVATSVTSLSSAFTRHGGSGAQAQAQRLLAAPGAFVVLMARVLLYVITLRGLISVAGGGDGRTGQGSAERWGTGNSGDSVDVDMDEVSEAPGGPPAEPGEWEGHEPAGSGGVAVGKRISPLADRGVLLLLVLLHNRRSTTPSATNAFRVAVASCVDADLENENNHTPAASAAGPEWDRSRARRDANGGGSNGVSGGSASVETFPMRVSFRAIFEAFGAALEGPPSSRVGGLGGGDKADAGRRAGGDAAGAGCEAVALLLYSLLQANPGFLRAAVVRSDADALLLPLLRTLHNCGSGGGKSAKTSVVASTTVDQPQQQSQQHQQQQQQKIPPAELYVPAIVVLLFSQDSAFNRQAFRQVVQTDVPWYSARNMRGASLGSLIVLCVLRCLGHNLSRLKDGYLLENCLAVLVNLAPQAEHLPPYAAQRLVSVLVAASKKWIDGVSAAAAQQQQQQQVQEAQVPAQAQAASLSETRRPGRPYGNDSVALGNGEAEMAIEEAAAAVGGSEGMDDGIGLSDTQELCGEVARVLFIFIWTCTRPRRLGSNVEILYAMLHDQSSLEAVFNHPAVASAGWAADLPMLLSHFQELTRKAEEAGGGHALTLEAAMDMVEKGVRHYTTEAMGMGRDGGGDAAEQGRGAGDDLDETMMVTLSYEEGENSEAFFLPYLWELVLARTPDLNWNARNVQMFTPTLQQQYPPIPNDNGISSSSMVADKPISQGDNMRGSGEEAGGGAAGGADMPGFTTGKGASTSRRVSWWRGARDDSVGVREEGEESFGGDLRV